MATPHSEDQLDETELLAENNSDVISNSSFTNMNDVSLVDELVTKPAPHHHTTTRSESARLRDQIKSAVYSMLTVLLYYFFSICLTFYNRHLFVTYRFPLSITLIHLIFKFLAAAIIRFVLNCCTRNTSSRRVTLDWYTYFTRILPTGVASAADIGLSNWSLQYITITLYTMSKSTVILFIFFFSILFKLEKWQRSIILVVSCISLGLFLFTYHSTQFHLFGFTLVMLASFSSGLRWTLAQSVTQKHELGLGNPIDMIFHIQPIMILFLLPLAVYIEGLNVISTDKFFRNDDPNIVTDHVLWLLVGAVLAFFLESSEFLVVLFTSSLTLSISGIFKEVCVIYLAVVWNHNKLNNMNTAGLVVCLLGIAIHVGLKAKQKAELIEEENGSDSRGGSITRGKKKTMSLSGLLAKNNRQRTMSDTAASFIRPNGFPISTSRESSTSSMVTNGKKLAVRKSYGWSTFYKASRDRHGHVESENVLLLESPVDPLHNTHDDESNQITSIR